MKILLAQSILGRKEKLIYPLGLAYLRGALGDHDVQVLDPNLEPSPFDSLRQAVRRMQPDVIGLSLRNIDTTHTYDAFSYLQAYGRQLRELRSVAPRTMIVAGGAGFSIFPEALMRRFPELDVGVRLEGERTLPDLLDNLGDYREVPGIFFRDEDGAVVAGEGRRPLDLRDVTPPDREALPIQPYLSQPYTVGIQTKRGCVFDCLYCIYPLLEGGYRVRLHDPEGVADEVERVMAAGAKEFYFVDQVFNFPVEHAIQVCEAIIARGLKPTWRAFFHEAYITPELVDACVRAGCRVFEFSPDGISDASLRALGKTYTFADIERAYAVIDRHPEARMKVSFMMAAPGERRPDLLHLAHFLARQSVKRRYLFFSTIEVMRIYPGTPVHRIALDEGMVRPDDDLLEPVFYSKPPMDALRWPLDLSYKAILAVLQKMDRRAKIPF